MKEIIEAMPTHRNCRRIMGVPASITKYARNLRRVPSFLFYGHRIETCGASVICREIIRPWGESATRKLSRNASALSEARFHESVKVGRGALRAFVRAV